MLFPQPMRVALVTAAFFASVACVPPAQIGQQDYRLTEEHMVLLAALQILEEEGYPILSSNEDGSRLATDWVESGEALRQNVTVSVQQSSLGVALSTRVLIAVPEEGMLGVQPKGKQAASIHLQGREYWIDYSRRDFAQTEESRIGQLIRARWKMLRRDHRADPQP